MLDILFSLQFAGIALLLILLALAIAFVCALLQQHLFYATAGEWLLDHVYCPLARVLLLMLMAFLIFPQIVIGTDYGELIELFGSQDFLINMVNILFVASLLLSFIPWLGHLALAMPILGAIATGLIFTHRISIPTGVEIDWIPGWFGLLRILALVLLGHLFSRWSSQQISLWLEYRYNVTRTRALVLEIHYLILQIPILLAYGHSLYQQVIAG